MQQLQGWGGAARRGSWPGCPPANKAPHSCPQAGLPPKLLLHRGSAHGWDTGHPPGHPGPRLSGEGRGRPGEEEKVGHACSSPYPSTVMALRAR